MKSSRFNRTRLLALTGLTLLIMCGTIVTALSQTYNGNVTFNTQASLDAWSGTYTQINGNVTIQGSTITDLTPLANISSITGYLKLQSNTNLTQLDGLDAITSIGNTLEINGNPVLNDASGLQSIASLGFSLVVTNNAILPNLDGLGSLTTIDEKITIINNALLANLDGLSNITSIGASIIVQDNPSLNDCCGLYELINSPGVSSTFTNNNTGCDSKTQVNTYCVDTDGDGVNITDGDCDNGNPDVYPGAPEVCDGVDNDCNEGVDEGLSVYNGNITLYTQAEVDAFSSCITTINGALLVGAPGCNIVDLSPLNNVVTVSGDVNISNTQLSSINGLTSLAEVGRFLGVYANNNLLTINAAFPNLVDVGAMVIGGNNSLTSINGFNNVTVTGDPGPELQLGRVQINYNPNLTTIEGFESITSIPYSLELAGNALSGGVSAFDNLQSIGGYLFISQDNAITTIDGFASVNTVLNMHITHNPQLVNVSGLGQLSAITGSCVITNNTSLSACCFIQDWIDNDVIGGTLAVSENATGCDSQQDIVDHCVDGDLDGFTVSDGDCDDNDPDLSPGATEICDGQDNDCDGDVDEGLSVYNGNVTLNTQADVDAFSSCITTLNGWLTISGADITDLSPLSALTFVSVLNIYNTPGLAHLTGLHNVSSVDNLEISGTQITSLSGLEGLITVSNKCILSGNNALTNLDGFLGLHTVESSLRLMDNLSLVDISGIQNLVNANNITVIGNSGLTDCCVLEELVTAGAVVYVSVYNNDTGCDTPAEVTLYCSDADGDGITFGDGDCNDMDPDIYPGASEICDGQDNDCNGLTDDDDPNITGQTTWYADADNDGAGDASFTIVSCTQPEGFVGNADDLCPGDGDKTEPGSCGCGVADTDSDSDGIADCNDNCQASPDITNFDAENCHCEPGFFPVTEEVDGVVIITGCQYCPAGFYCPDGIASYPCPVGEYSNSVGSIACVVCEECTTTEGVGSISCSPETTPPTVICRDITLELDANGQATITGVMIDNGSSDVCGIASRTPDQSIFSCADLGPNVVILTVEDNNGNTNTCVANVTVEDHIYPEFVSCPTDIGAGLCGDVVFWDEPTAIDNCPDITVMQTEGPANGSVFDEGETLVTYLAVDASGNVSSCAFTVTVNAISVAGGPNLNAYYGYPNSVDLSATVSGGTEPYTYLWFPADDLNDATDPTPTFTPSAFGTFVFTVIVTDNNGCTGTATQTVYVEDVRCNNNGNQTKVMICHDGETVCVNENAVAAHLGHGDYLGPCVQTLAGDAQDSDHLSVNPALESMHRNIHADDDQHVRVDISPNPFVDQVAIEVTLVDQQQVSIRVYDIHGMFVNELHHGELSGGSHTYQWLGKNTRGSALSSGIYLIVVQSDSEMMTKQVVLMD